MRVWAHFALGDAVDGELDARERAFAERVAHHRVVPDRADLLAHRDRDRVPATQLTRGLSCARRSATASERAGSAHATLAAAADEPCEESIYARVVLVVSVAAILVSLEC